MFRKLLSGFSKTPNTEKAVLSTMIRQNLGDSYSEMYLKFFDGRVTENSLLEYTKGRAIRNIAQIMPNIRAFIGDEKSEAIFWKTHVLPYLSLEIQALSNSVECDILITKSLDFAASLAYIAQLTPVDKSRFQFLSKFMQIQNSLFSKGGYFSNTPFWRLTQHENWRYIDSSVDTVYYLWIVLLFSDYETSDSTDNISTKIIELSEDLSSDQISKLFSHEVSFAIQQICLGSKYLSLYSLEVDGIVSPKIKTYLNLTRHIYGNGYEGSADYIGQFKASNGFNALQELVPDDNVLKSIPSDGFVVKVSLGGILHSLLATSASVSRNLLKTEAPKDFRTQFPHLAALII